MSVFSTTVGYWKFDESSGDAHDSSGKVNNLTNNNTVAYTTGKLNNGADFESTSSQYFSIANANQTGLSLTSNLSISCWVKLESAPSNASMVIMSRRTSNTFGYEFYYNDATGTKTIVLNLANAGDSSYQVTQTLNTGTFYHVVAVWTASTHTAEFYINGTSVGTDNRAGTLANGDAIFAIGSINTGGSYFDGIIDEIGIWNSALSAAEVTQLYNSGTPLPFSVTLDAGGASFTLTGVAVAMNIAKQFFISVGSFILSGIDVLFRHNTTSWTNSSKTSSSWTNLTKH